MLRLEHMEMSCDEETHGADYWDAGTGTWKDINCKSISTSEKFNFPYDVTI